LTSCPAKTSARPLYVNRNQIGAVVGIQPFGGQGLSGTGPGPKAGDPHYLPRFATEKKHHHQHHCGGRECVVVDAGGVNHPGVAGITNANAGNYNFTAGKARRKFTYSSSYSLSGAPTLLRISKTSGKADSAP